MHRHCNPTPITMTSPLFQCDAYFEKYCLSFIPSHWIQTRVAEHFPNWNVHNQCTFHSRRLMRPSGFVLPTWSLYTKNTQSLATTTCIDCKPTNSIWWVLFELNCWTKLIESHKDLKQMPASWIHSLILEFKFYTKSICILFYKSIIYIHFCNM